jgi:hypothetical protein
MSIILSPISALIKVKRIVTNLSSFKKGFPSFFCFLQKIPTIRYCEVVKKAVILQREVVSRL